MDPLTSLTRRDLLARASCGFGGVALTSLMLPRFARTAASQREARLHHAPRAKNVIFLYMDGGPSQVDTWDPKPLLERDAGKPFPLAMEPTQFDDIGNTLPSPWSFAKHGECGIEVSELFPYIARCVDKLAVIRSMTADFPEHTNANYFLHTGHGLQGRPSMGAWVGYGLGSENAQLPGYVVLHGGLIPPGGIDNFLSGFLPASYQASILRPAKMPIANIDPAKI
ncbi:MAG TPA: DUF1501 domain-containing protein, partial [Planctomycetota bacterium]|nr:DUF1501 domain-containing protein [Planctomycetota bacterium]